MTRMTKKTRCHYIDSLVRSCITYDLTVEVSELSSWHHRPVGRIMDVLGVPIRAALLARIMNKESTAGR